jgi:response regulator of citrate/malate metabolism
MTALTIWKAAFEGFLVVGLLSTISAGLLRITTKSFDLWILDRYLPVFPGRLLLVAVVFFVLAFAIWKAKLSH